MASRETILEKEINSWLSMGQAMRREDKELFGQMLSGVRAYTKAAEAKGESFSFESMCMALILEQQKMITKLLEAIA